MSDETVKSEFMDEFIFASHATTKETDELVDFLMPNRPVENQGNVTEKGGPGSGNFGHTGRPGHVGGSGGGGKGSGAGNHTVEPKGEVSESGGGGGSSSDAAPEFHRRDGNAARNRRNAATRDQLRAVGVSRRNMPENWEIDEDGNVIESHGENAQDHYAGLEYSKAKKTTPEALSEIENTYQEAQRKYTSDPSDANMATARAMRDEYYHELAKHAESAGYGDYRAEALGEQTTPEQNKAAERLYKQSGEDLGVFLGSAAKAMHPAYGKTLGQVYKLANGGKPRVSREMTKKMERFAKVHGGSALRKAVHLALEDNNAHKANGYLDVLWGTNGKYMYPASPGSKSANQTLQDLNAIMSEGK